MYVLASEIASSNSGLDQSKLPPLDIDEHGMIPVQDWLQLVVVYKRLIEIYDKKKTYISTTGETVIYNPHKTLLETYVGMLVLYGIYGIITMTGKGPLSSHMAWKSKGMRD